MKSCFTCKHRSKDEQNNWNEAPAYKCGNEESWKHNHLVLKGQVCYLHEFSKSWKGKAA